MTVIDIFIFRLKCHLNVTCLVVHGISIFKVSIDVRLFSSYVTLHVKFRIMHVNGHAFFNCAGFCMSDVKTCKKKLCQKYMLGVIETKSKF